MPKFGELLPAGVWAAATRTLTNPSGVFSDAARTLTDFDAHDLIDLPIVTTNYPYTAVSGGGLANVYGSWTQVVADVGTGKTLLWVLITGNQVTSTGWELEIGVGAAGSEAAVARFAGYFRFQTAVGGNPVAVFPFFVALAANARLSVRIKDDVGGSLGYLLLVGYA